MEQDPRLEPSSLALPLIDAIMAWCDQDLVIHAKGLQSFVSTEALLAGQLPILDRNRSMVSPRNPLDRDDRRQIMRDLCNVMELLKDDFKRRFSRRELFLRGVRVRPERTVIPQPIANEWASILRFDPSFGTVWVQQDQFGDLVVSKQPFAASTVAIAEFEKVIMPETIATWSDETILRLLEEHARRVVENDSQMLDPRKISLTPIILRKLRLRAKTGDMHGTLAAEARMLTKWIGERLPSFQVPSSTTIENGIREEYRTLTPRSKPTIPSLGD